MGRYAIMIVLALTFALMAYGHGLRTIFWVSELEATRNFSLNQARNIAQSAAMIASMNITDEVASFTPSLNTTIRIPADGSFATWPAMQGNYRYEIQNRGDSLLILRSFGEFQDQIYRVDVTIASEEDVWNPNVSRAVFAGSRIDLSGSARITGHVATNATNVGAVRLQWSSVIDSSLAIGPGGIHPKTVVNARPFNANVGLGLRNLTREETYPLPVFPPSPASAGTGASVATSGNTSRTIGPLDFENLYIPEISVRSNTTLTINVGSEDRDLHVGRLDIQQGNINIVGTGKLTLYVEDDFNLGGSSTFNMNRSTETSFIYFKGAGMLDFGGSTKFNAGIFAQNANIRVRGSGGIQGNIMAGGASVEITGAANLNSRVLYAPNAHVSIGGSGSFRGGIVSDRFTASGSARVIFEEEFDDEFSEMPGGSDRRNIVRSWR